MPDSLSRLSNFSNKNRLVSKQDFQSVFADPQKASHRFLLALYRPNQYSYPRLGLIIRKDLVKRAADRNLIRRVLRESFRQHKGDIGGFDIILLLKQKITAIDRKAWKEVIDNLWEKINI